MKRVLKISLTAFITVFILLGSAMPVNMVGNWYQQFMPNIGNKQITDITFLDSLTGYAVATHTSDSSYILKTTNSGDSWQIIHRQLFAMTHIQFLNNTTGFAGGGYLYKTINGGLNWTQVNTPATTVEKLYAIDENIIWFVNSNSLVGGVFFTFDGGSNWQQQLNLGSDNPDHIYMFNARIGFICDAGGNAIIRKTTNSGLNWDTAANERFIDIYFTDSLTGWIAYGTMKETTNGGFNWITQTIPSGGIIVNNAILNFSNINKDTIWGVGGWVTYLNGQSRGILYRTTNGGSNWLYQVPDTTIHIGKYDFVNFINKNKGWANTLGPAGIHTTNGGDTLFLEIKQISNEVPSEFRLYQNFPNPFNPKTIIKYQISNNKYQKGSNVKLTIFDIAGKEVITLVNQKQEAGIYQVDFTGNRYSSGVYFYSLIVDNKIIDTKKMMLIK